jgi:threonyl-tRNA synthetase
MLEVSLGKKTQALDPSLFQGGPKSGLELVKSSFPNQRVFGMKVDGQLMDLHMEVPVSAKRIDFIREDSAEAAEIIRHSCAHILAQAVKAIYPEVQVTIGPVIENGFFYDFSKKEPFKEEDLPAIEAKMKEIIEAKYELKREVWPVAKAVDFFKNLGEHYKVEIIQDLAKNEGVTSVSVYWQGPFVDLCRGPHVVNTSHIPAFKLTHVAGAYWRGDEKNEMLTRIYGTAFPSRDELKAYLTMLEEAKKRDHRKIGAEQKLFSFHPEAPASPFFHPNGAFIYGKIQEFIRRLNEAYGFETVLSPLVMSQELWKKSGHYDNYRENMYFTKVDERDFAIKPMNCPGHCLIFKSQHHSYRDLPLRYAEFGRVHRHERSGVTAGLFRVRSFVQDDAHVYCAEGQIESEIVRILEMVDKTYKAFGFEYRVELSTRPVKRIGSDEVWDLAESILERALKARGLDFKVNPGDGAFYGPKIDYHLKDSIGRTHQCGTVQLDFSMPGRFELSYVGQDNSAHIPVMIHRAIVGSFERFFGIFIEHVAGHFPFGLAPKQAVILSIADTAKDFSTELNEMLKAKGYRTVLDDGPDKLSAKIKNYHSDRPPYMLIIGAKEAEGRTVSVRDSHGKQRNNVSIDELLKEFEAETRRFEIS